MAKTKQPTPGRVIVPVVSDMHGGHINGLMNPETVLELEDQAGNPYLYKPELTEIQKYLWNILTDAVEKITTLAAEIASVLKVTDYHAQGYATTREVADQLGESVSNTAAKLERAAEDGLIERLQDSRKRLWWRLPKESEE